LRLSVGRSRSVNGGDRYQMAKVACPCCGYLVFDSRGDYEICPICSWEDDLVQIADPWFEGGANTPSLERSQRNFRTFGAKEERFAACVRDPGWRPVVESDRNRVTTPREIERKRDNGTSIPYEYWLRTDA